MHPFGSVCTDLLSVKKEGDMAPENPAPLSYLLKRGFTPPGFSGMVLKSHFLFQIFWLPSNGINRHWFPLLQLCTNRLLECILVIRGVYSREESCYDFLCSPPFSYAARIFPMEKKNKELKLLNRGFWFLMWRLGMQDSSLSLSLRWKSTKNGIL